MLDNRSKAFFFCKRFYRTVLPNKNITAFFAFRVQNPRGLIIFLPDVPRDKVNRLTTVQLGSSIARFLIYQGTMRPIRVRLARFRASFFSSKFVSMSGEIERHVLGHRRPARFPRSRKDRAPIKFDSVAR